MGNVHRVCHDEERPYALPGHRREGPVEVPRPAGPDRQKLQPQRLRRCLDVVQNERMGGASWVREDGHAPDLGNRFPEQLQVLAEDVRGDAVRHPVTFPPGRARLGMSPSPTGSVRLMPTMGIVAVALLAARAPGVGVATMTSTLSRTSSVASAGSRSSCPSACRNSMTMF